MAWMLTTITLWDEGLDRLTNQIGARVPEKVVSLAVNENNTSLLIYNQGIASGAASRYAWMSA